MAPAWTGVQYLWNFLSGNAGAGPYGREAELAELVTGDLVQLGGEDGRYYHTLFICGRRGGELLIAAHSFDAFERPLSSYDYARLRPIKIEGCRAVRTPPPGGFERLLSGEALPPGCF